MNRRHVLALGALLCTAPLHLAAQNPPSGAPARPATDTTKKESDFAKLVKGATARSGFFDTYEKADKLYLAIPKDRLGKDFLITYEIAQGIGAAGLYGGTMLNIFEGSMVALERHGDKIYFVLKNPHYTATAGTPMAKAVDLSYGTSILQSAKIEATREDSAVVIDTYPWWVSDLSDVGNGVRFAVAPRPGQPGRATLDASRSYLDGVKVFPKNVNIRAKLTFQPGEPVGLQTVGDSRYVPISIHYSLVALPEVPMTPRVADDRMGYFLTVHKNFSRDDKTYFERFVNKWRLECAGPATNGLCDPKQQIVYYVDRTVPEELRPFVMAGVESWNSAFEAAGFRHAIRADILPDSADAEDIRFHTIRWNTSDIPGYGAIGPSVVDPRTGEVLDADILFESSFIQGFRNTWQGLVNPAQALEAVLGGTDSASAQNVALGGETSTFAAEFAAQGATIHAYLVDEGKIGPNDPVPLAYVGEGLKWAVMHEVGHTLGLRHNFRSSSDTPLDSLYSKSFAERNGLYSSVMEYPVPNVPPHGKAAGYFYTPGAGSEDRWVISYGYTPDPARAEQLARQGAAAGHALGTDEDANGLGVMDPSVSVYDMSSDPLGWAKQRTTLLQGLITRLPTTALADNSPYSDLTQAYGGMLGQEVQAIAMAVKYIGGQYVNREHVGDPGAPSAPFVSVPRAKQKEALDFLVAASLSDTAFEVPAAVFQKLGANRWAHWGNNSTINGRIDYPLHEQILGVQSQLLTRLTDPILFGRIRDAETKFGAANVVTIPELVQQVTQATWSEVLGATAKNINANRRDLQRAYLDRMSDIVATPPARMPADARSVVRYRLMDLRSKINAKLAAAATLDSYTVAHLTDAKARIDHALEAGLDVEKGR